VKLGLGKGVGLRELEWKLSVELRKKKLTEALLSNI